MDCHLIWLAIVKKMQKKQLEELLKWMNIIFLPDMSIVDAISKYYIFDVDGTLFYIHTVDIKDSPLQQLSMYEIIKEDIK
jgi:hypothetical protein